MFASSLEERLGKFDPNMAEVYLSTAFLYEEQGNNEEASESFEKACMVYEKMNDGDPLGKVRAYSIIAEKCFYKKFYNEAIKYFEKALLTYKENLVDDYLLISQIYSYLGIAFDTIGEYEKAEDSFGKALEISKKTGNDDITNEIERVLNDLKLKMKKE